MVLYSFVAKPEVAPTEIRIGAPELRWLRDVWQGQFGRRPSEKEMREAVAVYSNEEMRYREALAMGLDRDDTIVRRRMAQKYDFLMGSQANDSVPTDADLRAVFSKNPSRYTAPGLLNFCQVYFGEGMAGLQAASFAVARVAPSRRNDPEAIRTEGVPLPFARCYKAASKDETQRNFGSAFAKIMDKLPIGAWQGPVESGYGFHAVLLVARTPGRPLKFDEARRAVEADWREQITLAARKSQETSLRARYQVTVDEEALRDLSSAPVK